MEDPKEKRLDELPQSMRYQPSRLQLLFKKQAPLKKIFSDSKQSSSPSLQESDWDASGEQSDVYFNKDLQTS